MSAALSIFEELHPVAARIMPPGPILAFDLAENAGWAARFDGQEIESGALDLHACDDEHPGARWPRLRELFRAIARGQTPRLVAWERAITFGHHHGDGTLPILQACLVEVVYAWGATPLTVMPSTLKKFATGRGDSKKPAVIAAARARWPRWVPDNPAKPDDEADARFVLAWAETEIRTEV